MKKGLVFILLLSFIAPAYSQTCADYVVQLTAGVKTSPPQLALFWTPVPGSTSYKIFKKSKQSPTWTSLATTSSTSNSYLDNDVVTDSAYEYAVQSLPDPAFGYIYVGIKAPPIHNRGTLLLIVDSTFTDSCAADISQLIKDISGDGWRVLRKDILRTTGHVAVKAHIKSVYSTNPDLKAVLILGHIAVPYSGNYNTTNLLAPDGHTDHAGAWPADSYYGEMNGSWTDLVSNTLGSRPANQNLPGDGKWDQTQLPNDMELQVSRIDLSDMPSFAKTEVQLMRNYLARDHQYKTDQLVINRKALIDDNFGKFSGEGFAAAAYRLSPLVGNTNIDNVDFITTLNTTSYQWAFACGGGSFTTCTGIGATTDIAANAMNTIFTIAFGSYFGDWNVQNNFLRAPLCASTPALTSCWSGRPHWYFHHMALGEHIGYSTIATQNNVNTYTNPVNFYPNYIHPALMGDLTLRTDYIKPPTAATLSNITGGGAKLTWAASPDASVIGYYVYRSDEEFGTYQKRSGMLTTLSYIDSFGTDGQKFYMVRAVKLQQTPSGSYYNLSLGSTSSQAMIDYPYADNTTGIAAINVANNIVIYPNPATDNIYVTLKDAVMGEARVSIIDQQGKRVKEQRITLENGNNTITLNVTSLPAGLYHLSINNSTTVYTAKWIKSDLK